MRHHFAHQKDASAAGTASAVPVQSPAEISAVDAAAEAYGKRDKRDKRDKRKEVDEIDVLFAQGEKKSKKQRGN